MDSYKENPLKNLFYIDFGIQGLMWIHSAWNRTEKFYDLTGSLTFITLIVLSFLSNRTPQSRQLVQTVLVLIWALRLGSYLFARINTDGHDRRFNGVRDNPPKFFVFWFLQGVWVIVTLLPSIMVNLADTTHPARINNLDYAGWCLWLVGFALEATADFQKSQFRKNPANQGKFINTGLWSISRHPNYLGEIIMWFALYLPAFNATNGWTRWLLVLCPAFDAFLLTSVSGIPLLEKHGMKKWGSEPGYQQYLKATSVLIPYLW